MSQERPIRWTFCSFVTAIVLGCALIPYVLCYGWVTKLQWQGKLSEPVESAVMWGYAPMNLLADHIEPLRKQRQKAMERQFWGD